MSLVKGLVGFFVGATAGVVVLSMVSLFVPQIQGSDTENAAVTPSEQAVVTPEPAVKGDDAEQEIAKVAEPSSTEPAQPETEEAPVEPKVEDAPKVEEPKQEISSAESEPETVEPEPETDATEEPAQEPKVVEPEPEMDATEEPAQEPKVVVEEPSENLPAASDANASPEVEQETVPEAETKSADDVEVAIAAPELEPEPETVEEPKTFNLPTIDAKDPETEEAPTKVEDEPAEEQGITIGKKPSSLLPTITEEEPKVDAKAPAIEEEPAVKQGITIGKKPSSLLPSITDEESDADSETAKTEEEGNDSEAFSNKAIELNAAKFEGSERPLMSVILLDIGSKGLAVEKLKALNAPVTIAILTDDPNASARALEYSAAGFEVIVMVSEHRNDALNIAQNPDQVEDALDVMFNNIPNAIGLLDSAQGNIQKKGRIAGAIVDNFVDTGHGLVTYAKGLNSIDREARAAGVRTAKVARTLDANSENKSLITRYLDRVSLDAGRDGSAIVLGTTAKDTVAALAGWVLSSKGQSVALAPVSAILLGK